MISGSDSRRSFDEDPEEYQNIQSPILQPRNQDLESSLINKNFGSQMRLMEMESFLKVCQSWNQKTQASRRPHFKQV